METPLVMGVGDFSNLDVGQFDHVLRQAKFTDGMFSIEQWE